jgi:hypothetical protein
MSTIAKRNFLQGHNYYVPAMQAGGDLGQALQGRFSLGTAIIVAAAAAILSAQSINAAVDTTTLVVGYTATVLKRRWVVMAVRLRLVASGAAASTAVTVYGRDYLGQKVREDLTSSTAPRPCLGRRRSGMLIVSWRVSPLQPPSTLAVGTGLGRAVLRHHEGQRGVRRMTSSVPLVHSHCSDLH